MLKNLLSRIFLDVNEVNRRHHQNRSQDQGQETVTPAGGVPVVMSPPSPPLPPPVETVSSTFGSMSGSSNCESPYNRFESVQTPLRNFHSGAVTTQVKVNSSSNNGKTTSSAQSTPNLPTTTPVHRPMLPAIPAAASSRDETYPPEATNGNYLLHHRSYQCQSVMTTSSAPYQHPLPLSSNLANNLSASHLAKVEEKIQGRGITRSSASYGIQQLLQEQVGAASRGAAAEKFRFLIDKQFFK